MKQFGVALACLFLLVMTFAWQHFKAIEYGYKIETLRVQRDGMLEVNRALRLEEASLRDPERIDTLARKLGLQSPQAGQVLHMDTAVPDSATPVMASVTWSRCRGKIKVASASGRPIGGRDLPTARLPGGRRPALQKLIWRLPAHWAAMLV